MIDVLECYLSGFRVQRIADGELLEGLPERMYVGEDFSAATYPAIADCGKHLG